jgi:hypothetical protein
VTPAGGTPARIDDVTTAPLLDASGPDPVRPRPTRGADLRREIVIAGVIAATLAIIGLPLGLLWRVLAPRVEFVMTADGPVTVLAEPEGFVADDGWYLLITVAAGVVAALLVWALLRRRRGPLIVLGLIVGCVAGAVLTQWIGHQIGYAHFRDLARSAPVGTHFFRPPSVRAGHVGLWFGVLPRVQGAVLVQAVAAATTYLLLAAFHADPELGGPDRHDDPPAGPGQLAGPSLPDDRDEVSWERTGWTGPPGSPVPPGSDPAASPHG